MVSVKKDVPVDDHFVVVNKAKLLISGILPGAFGVELWNPSKVEVSGTITVTITELGGGNYGVNFTPNALGVWLLIVKHATYFAYGHRENYHVYAQDIDDISAENLGPGDKTTVILIQEVTTAVPIAGAFVRVKNAAMTATVAFGYTKADGKFTCQLFADDYKVFLQKLGQYNFTLPEDLTVTTDPTNVTYEGTPFDPGTPPSAETCIVFGHLIQESSTPISAEVEAILTYPSKFLSSKAQVIRRGVTTSSAEVDGYWSLVLNRSSEYTAENVKYAFTMDGKEIGEATIPDQSSVDFADLSIG